MVQSRMHRRAGAQGTTEGLGRSEAQRPVASAPQGPGRPTGGARTLESRGKPQQGFQQDSDMVRFVLTKDSSDWWVGEDLGALGRES